jgi:uncharacterized protein Smg (DUF494 family)
MKETRTGDAVQRILGLLAERLENWLDGEELAFETLGEALEEGRFAADEVQSALLVLRSLLGDLPDGVETALEGVPGDRAHRVLSDEERSSLSPEAWGALIDLKRKGSLTPGQFERVLEMLGGCGVRPVGVDLALEVATRVALLGDREAGRPEVSHGEFDLAN